VLAGIVSQETVPPAARVSAAGILLDRGWGKAAQPIGGEDGGPLRVVKQEVCRTELWDFCNTITSQADLGLTGPKPW
jgi:hypothetical protein